MLTMSCNDPYYQALLGTIKNTWAKPLIQNKYPNITWFGYTSCDEKHPVPVVDFENHMIYVNTGDELKDTYYKSYDAYHMIKNVIDFDYVVRTNTSVFVNIDNMLKRFDEAWKDDDNSVIGTFEQVFRNHEFKFWIVFGYFYAMKKEYFEYGLSDRNINIDVEDVQYHDDVIFSIYLQNKLGPDYIGKPINENSIINWYKPKPFDFEPTTDYRNTNLVFSYDPQIINSEVVVRMRPLYELIRNQQGEIEHFYEINDALKNGR